MPVKFQFGEKIVDMNDTEQEGRAVVLRFLRNYCVDDKGLDAELERLHGRYTAALTSPDAYPRNFARGAIKLINEIDSADGTLPEY